PEARRNEVLSFVKGGLQDLSISRTTFKWGIPVPGNEAHIMYVWLDALVNYLTAVGYPDESQEEYQSFWPASLHMVGKDILRFHAVYWPAFLMSAQLPVPKRVFAHGWWTNEGEKISKSLGNVISADNLIGVYGLDQTRYFLMREVPFGSDGNFARAQMITRINSDLANNVGNLAQRTLSFINKNCDGMLPEPPHGANVDYTALMDQVRGFIDRQAFHHALATIIERSDDANQRIDRDAPWSLKKANTPESLATMNQVLYELADEIRVIAMLLQPVIPDCAAKLLDQLGVPESQRSFAHINTHLMPGTPIEKPMGVFPRFEQIDDSA
ncbi:MAG: methionine--tRNA ligase, partial [Rickettsiales bacterium]|nr:methionine--tRNA ligase [Rickettsiales bacterium]